MPNWNGHRLFDQFVRADQDGRREGKVKRFCHPSIDDQLKGHGLLNRNVSGLSAFQYLVDKIAVATNLTRQVCAIAQQSARVAELSEPVHRRQTLFRGKRGDPTERKADDSTKQTSQQR
jgi:hypothetical protein